MSSHTVTVDVEQGTLRGQQVVTKTGFTYYSFTGIPYAKPPLGQLRFKDPLPAESWTGVRNAMKEGPVCAQKDLLLMSCIGEEDCLFLNVYSPKMSERLLPVMVWIHGGGFATGSGDATYYGPDHLVQEDVIIVTLNYRLGPLGFLCLDTAEVPGNAGLKDQVMALRWVKINIARFGGDPDNVMLFGESAGAASVHLHLFSPMSRGLFKRCIIQSGSALNWWALTSSTCERAFRLGHALGCHTRDPQQLLEFLHKVPAIDLVEAAEKTLTEKEKKLSIFFPFVPTIEKEAQNGEIFLAASPHDLIEQGKFHHVPLVIGMTSREGLMMLKDMDENVLRKSNEDPQCFIPLNLKVPLENKLSKRIGQRIKEFYFQDKPVCQDTIEQYIDLQTDLWFKYHINQAIRKHVSVCPVPVYQYMLTFEGSLGLFKSVLGLQHYRGVCHADDLGYLFQPHLLEIDVDPESPEAKCLKRMVKMWTNFAKRGNPTPERTNLIDVTWTPTRQHKFQYLNIAAELKMEEDNEDDRMKFWDDLYKIPALSQAKL